MKNYIKIKTMNLPFYNFFKSIDSNPCFGIVDYSVYLFFYLFIALALFAAAWVAYRIIFVDPKIKI